MTHNQGVPPSGSGYSAESEPISVVSAADAVSIPNAANLSALLVAFEAAPEGDIYLDARLHALLPEPKAIQPPRYSSSLDAVIAALTAVFPLADWRKLTPKSLSIYAASPYNAAAQKRYDGYGANDAMRLASAFLRMWVAFQTKLEARVA